jgi:polyphosphate kinase 2 (PPK2 family)
MLENVTLKKRLSRQEYKRILPGLQARLFELEEACWTNGVPTILVFEGWDAAGKGSTIAALTQRLDPRGFRMFPITAPRTYEHQRPWLWRFWLKTPGRGEMAIFDHSWYRRVLDDRVERAVSKQAVKEALHDIVEFERMLAEDGTLILKFFLHISKKEQKQRFAALAADPLEAWRVTAEDWERHRQYGKYRRAAEEMLEFTNSGYAPWTIADATSKWYPRKLVFDTVIAAMEARLGPKAPPKTPAPAADSKDAELRQAMESMEGGL